MSTPETSAQIDERIADRFQLKALVEACLVLEEGIAGVRDIDLGLMMGTGMIPGPFARADFRGLDDVLAALEKAEDEWGEGFEPPLVLRRLVAQGRLGAKSGQGFYPYPQPDEGYETAPVKLDTRGEIAILWLDNPPANSLAPHVIEALETAWRSIEGSGVKAMIIASPNPALFCAGADIKAFTSLDEAGGRELLNRAHELFRDWEKSRIMTIAAVNGLAFGGGCEIAMACDVRLAGYSASFGQPEINLGIIPGFGGTQRLPRLVGAAKALEMNTTGEPISAEEGFEYGLVNRLVPDHELFDTALAWARKYTQQAPLALEAIKRASHQGDLDDGIAAEKEAFASVFASEDAREGIGAFLQKRTSGVQGQVSSGHDRLAELIRSARSIVALTGAGMSVPSGIPDFRSPGSGLWENVDPMEVAHISVWRRRPGALLGVLRRALRAARRQGAERRPPRARRARHHRDHAEHRRPPRGGRLARRHRDPRLRSRPPPARSTGPATRSPRRGAGSTRPPTACRAATAASPSSPTSSCSARCSTRRR